MTANALRQAVLQRAIQGRLVPQDSSDEPASVLLQNIEREQKNCLGKDYMDFYIIKRDDGRIYEKTGNLENDISEEVTFELPAGWEYVRLSTICALENIETSVGEELPYFDAQTLRGIKKETMVESGKIVNEADRVILVDGENSGEVFIIPHRGYMGSTFRLLKSNCNINTEFLDQILKFYQPRLRNNKTGSAIPHLNKKLFKSLIIGLPPLAEQQRIVEALDEIYPLLDEYEKLEEEASRLDGEICDKLRNSMLQYAMQGKLVPQDSSDEPASVLLEKITREGQKKLGKSYVTSRIYKGTDDKTYEKIGEKVGDLTNEVPFDIPDTWSWVRLRDIAELNPRNKVDDNLDAGFIPMASLVGGYCSEYSYEVKKWKSIKNGFTHFSEGDVVVAKITPCLQNRKSAIIHSLPNGIGAGTTELHVVRPLYDDMCREYLLWIFKSSYFIDSAAKGVSGTAGQQRVGKDFMSRFLIPLPPRAEQIKIAEAVDKAFAQIDALEAAIKNSGLA